MDNRALSQWMHDYANHKPQQHDDEEEEDEWEYDEPSWLNDHRKFRLDLDWYKHQLDVRKHIPKLTTIVLGQIIKTVNCLATSGENDLDQLNRLKATIPSNLLSAICSQLSFTALRLRNFLQQPLSYFFEENNLETTVGCIKQEEDVYRYLYHHHPSHPFLLQTESQLLLNVYENYPLFTKNKPAMHVITQQGKKVNVFWRGRNVTQLETENYPIIEHAVDDDEEKMSESDTEVPKKEIPVSAINTYEKFIERWNQLTGGVFKFVDWTNVLAGGGSVLHCLRPLDIVMWLRIMYTETQEEAYDADMDLYNDPDSNFEFQNGKYKAVDIDLYIYGLSAEQTRLKVQEIFEAVIKVEPKARLFINRDYPTINIMGPSFKPIQIIVCLHKSPAEILLHYDLNCVCVGFNGKDVLCLPKFVIAMKYKLNILDSSMDTQDKFQVMRLHKYGMRGFSTSMPLHFRMHGYFDQEVPSNEELVKDVNHPVYYFLCEIMHLDKFRLLHDHAFKPQRGIWCWERYWQSGFTLAGRQRLPGPKKNNVIEVEKREIPLPINQEQNLIAFTKHLQRDLWAEAPTRYFSLQHYLYRVDYDKEIDPQSKHEFNRNNIDKLQQRLNEVKLTVYNESQYLQHFYLNCCVPTKTYKPDLSKLANPYMGINTSIARIVYYYSHNVVDIQNFYNIESGRIMSDPFSDEAGHKWQLILESGKDMPIVFVHLKLLESVSVKEAFSTVDQAPILATNFIITFRHRPGKIEGTRSHGLSLDGSKIFSETSDTWSTYFHGTYINAKAANPLKVECDPAERCQAIVDNSVKVDVIIQTMTIDTPVIAF